AEARRRGGEGRIGQPLAMNGPSPSQKVHSDGVAAHGQAPTSAHGQDPGALRGGPTAATQAQAQAGAGDSVGSDGQGSGSSARRRAGGLEIDHDGGGQDSDPSPGSDRMVYTTLSN